MVNQYAVGDLCHPLTASHSLVLLAEEVVLSVAAASISPEDVKGMAMDPGDVGIGRLKGLAGAAGRKVADSTSAARQRVADAAADAQERAKQSAEQVKAKVADVKDSLSARSSRNRDDPADLSALTVDAKLLYCRVLVSLALVDAVLDPREIANLYLFASTIGLDGEARSELRGEITGAQRVAASDAEVRGGRRGSGQRVARHPRRRPARAGIHVVGARSGANLAC